MEAKTGLRSSTIVWNVDTHYPRSYHLSYNISSKVQTQGLIVKESKPENSKPENSKPKELKLGKRKSSALPYTDKPANSNYKDKKQEWLKKKKNSISMTRDNANKSKKKQTSGNIS